MKSNSLFFNISIVMLSFTLHFSAQQCNSQRINCVNENRIYSTQLGQLCHFSMALAFIFMYCYAFCLPCVNSDNQFQ